jgi:hypothetical protein
MLGETSIPARMRLPRLRVGAIAAVALATGLITWLVLRPDTEHEAVSPTASAAVPEIVAPARLRALAATLGHPFYWVGAKPGMRYELTQAAGGRMFIRYLRPGVKVGDRRARSLAVGTYAVQDAFARTEAAGKLPGAVTRRLAGGGIAVYARSRPTSVYFAYPDSKVQVEVYDPSGRTARQLVLAGQVVPIR